NKNRNDDRKCSTWNISAGRLAACPRIHTGGALGRVVAIVNQKGGVGKTTPAVNLSAALAIAERPTLLIDADPQANSTRALGVPADPAPSSLYDALTGDATLDELKLGLEELPNLALVPGDRELIGAEVELVEREGREQKLKELIAPIRDAYAAILID